MSEYCKQRVYGDRGSYLGRQCSNCSNNVWKDGYCKIHHPDYVQERREKSVERFKQKEANNPYTLLKKEVDRTKELEAQVESLKLKWTKELPSKPGWYWIRGKLYDDGLRCVEIQDYAGKLWKYGKRLDDDDDFWENFEWAGPIPVPEG